jgi:hypothetical protein
LKGRRVTIFEPLFVAFVLAVMVGLAVAAHRWIRVDRSRSFAMLRIVSLCMALYAAIDVAIAWATSREVNRVGDTRCFDDWCITVTGARRTADGLVEVALQLSSHAKRITQGERGTVAYLLDAQGRRYDAIPQLIIVPFDTPLQPGQAVSASRSFRVPAELHKLDFVYEHEGFPIQLFIIGEAGSWFHGPPITPLDVN